MSNVPGTKSGHGWVWERPDGMKARCGGPRMCSECKEDQKLYSALHPFVVEAPCGGNVPSKYPHYSGMTYEQASREAERLIKSYGWFLSLDKLNALAIIMQRELDYEPPPIDTDQLLKDWKKRYGE